MKGLKIMKKLTIIVASLVALTIATVAQARDQIKIVGSSTVFPYAVSYTHLTLPTKRIV